MKRKVARTLVSLALLLVLYLGLWPTVVQPVPWQAPDDPGLTGLFASNGKLASFELLAPELSGPEAISLDAQGRLYTGTLDGKVVRLTPGGGHETLANTGGRPLGLKVLGDGALVVADAYRGLLRVSPDGGVHTLVNRDASGPFGFTDDVDVLPSGELVFTDASKRFGLPEFELDALEHGPTGTVYLFDPRTGKLRTVARGFAFANGIASEPDGMSVLVCETWSYRVVRVWLYGPKRGQREVVIDNLPGFPDNITYDVFHDLFWVALGSPRDAALDLLAPYPALRKVVARLPKALRPKAKRHAMAVGLRRDGSVAYFFDDPHPSSYSPLTTVRATQDALYLGSFQHAGIGRVELGRLGVH